MAKNTALPEGITQADIEAFMAAKKAAEAEKEAKARSSNKKAANSTDYATAKKTAVERVQKEFGGLAFHTCSVTGGRKYEVGTEVQCIWVGVNKFLQDTARIVLKDGTEGWINPKFLKAGKKMSDAKIAAIEAEREEESSETVLLPASIGVERDAAVVLNYAGWFKGMWMPKTMVERMTDPDENGVAFYAIPAWKVRKEIGPDSLEKLREKQGEFEKAVKAA